MRLTRGYHAGHNRGENRDLQPGARRWSGARNPGAAFGQRARELRDLILRAGWPGGAGEILTKDVNQRQNNRMARTEPARPGDQRHRPRLLVLDALGGPRPQRLGPSLAGLADLDIVCLPPPFLGERESRIAELVRWGNVTVADDPTTVVERALERTVLGQIDGVFCQAEPLMLAAASIAKERGLPANSVESTGRLTNKLEQRHALARAGIPTPPWCAITSSADVEVARSQVPFPAVLKPAVGMGGTSLAVVQEPDDLLSAYEWSSSHYLRDPRMKHREPTFILEELIRGERWHTDRRFGDYVSVESLVWDGVVRHLTVTDKLVPAFPFREVGDIMPSSLPAEAAASIIDMTAAAIRALGMTTGAVHTEQKLTGVGPRVIEVNGRVGGPIPDLLYKAAGVDIIAELGAMALGSAPVMGPLSFSRYAGYFTPQAPTRAVRVQAVRGLDKAKAVAGVDDLIVDCGVGSTPNWWMGERGRLYRGWLSGATVGDLLETFDTVGRTLTFDFVDV